MINYNFFPSNDLRRIDDVVGRNIKALRVSLKYTQKDLAKALNLSLQQVQKYETGVNRVSCSYLYCIACFFKVSSDYFFNGLRADHSVIAEPGIEYKTYKYDNYAKEDKAQLMSVFNEILDHTLRYQLLDLANCLLSFDLKIGTL
ncbi:MAG: helix-turn-helix domain-containing protein [Rickettsiaceae bacterium]